MIERVREAEPRAAAPTVESPAPAPAPATAPATGPATGPAPARPHSAVRLGRAVIQAKLTVGPADDPYEREADDVARRVVAAIARGTGDEAAAHEEGADPSDGEGSSDGVGLAVQRIQRAPAEIGADGGDLDRDTDRMLRSARAGGAPLPSEARSKMESAFGADFGSVRVHAGPTAAELSDRIQAKAFTTGNDIFFRDGLPDTSTTGGQSLLAHELTHTIQQGGHVHRSAHLMRKWWKFGRGKKKKMEISGPIGPATMNGGDAQEGLAAAGYTLNDVQPPAPEFSGKAGAQDNPYVEMGKPAAAMVASAGAAAGGGVGSGEFGGAGGLGGGTLGLLTAGDAGIGLYNANSMRQEANAYGDSAMGKQASGKAKDQSAQLGMGAVNAAKGGAAFGDALQGGAEAVAQGAAPTAAAVTAGALGIVGGSAMVIQGTWRGGKAVMKLCRLTWGRGKQMLSQDGARWKAKIVGAEQFKLAINGLKIAAGALGIAAGALLIVGSPIGWAIGIAAAVGAGAYAISKIVGKVRNAWNKSRAAKLEGAQLDIGSPEDVQMGTSDGPADPMTVLADQGYDTSQFIAAGPQNARAPQGEGFNAGPAQIGAPQGVQMGTMDGPADPMTVLADQGYDTSQFIAAGPQNARPGSGGGEPGGAAGGAPDNDDARQALIAEADRVAVMASANAAVAAEMRDALAHGDKDFVFGAIERAANEEDFAIGQYVTEIDDARLHDSFQLLSAININPDQALAGSGQLLIEQKLSKAEAM